MCEEECPWEKDGVKPDDDWSSLVFLRVLSDFEDVLLGHVFIIDRNKQNPKWKLPGGHKKPGETPLDTAKREVLGETYLLPEVITYVGSVWQKRTSHWKCYFVGNLRLSDINEMCKYHPENEGEEPWCFSIEEFRELVRTERFLSAHLRALAELHLI